MVRRIFCGKCGGEGQIYTSRYGGNDPDVWPTGQCDACEGSGDERCSKRSCASPAVGFDEDGDPLCEDCMFEWVESMNEQI